MPSTRPKKLKKLIKKLVFLPVVTTTHMKKSTVLDADDIDKLKNKCWSQSKGEIGVSSNDTDDNDTLLLTTIETVAIRTQIGMDTVFLCLTDTNEDVDNDMDNVDNIQTTIAKLLDSMITQVNIPKSTHTVEIHVGYHTCYTKYGIDAMVFDLTYKA